MNIYYKGYHQSMGGGAETVSSGNESTPNILNILSLITQCLVEVFGLHIAYSRCVVNPKPHCFSGLQRTLLCMTSCQDIIQYRQLLPSLLWPQLRFVPTFLWPNDSYDHYDHYDLWPMHKDTTILPHHSFMLHLPLWEVVFYPVQIAFPHPSSLALETFPGEQDFLWRYTYLRGLNLPIRLSTFIFSW